MAGWLPLRDLKKPMFKDTAKIRLEQLKVRPGYEVYQEETLSHGEERSKSIR